MTLQQWCFSFRGRLGRRDFWVWQGVWLVSMVLLFILADYGLLDTQMAAFGVVCLLWPCSAVIVKRLHDRDRKGWWALLLVVAWILLAGNWAVLGSVWPWILGRFIPALVLATLLFDLGIFTGTAGDNRFGSAARPVNYFARVDHQ